MIKASVLDFKSIFEEDLGILTEVVSYVRHYKDINGLNYVQSNDQQDINKWMIRAYTLNQEQNYDSIIARIGQKQFNALYTREGFYETFLKEYWSAYKKMVD